MLKYTKNKRHSDNLARDVLHVFTDGSCWPNPGPGGWGAVLVWNNHTKELYGFGGVRTTNNVMELTAIIKALEHIVIPTVPIIVYCDSMYAINSVTRWTGKWRAARWRTASGQPVANMDVIIHLSDLLQTKFPHLKFKHVRGHNGDMYNERADYLANCGRLRKRKDQQ